MAETSLEHLSEDTSLSNIFTSNSGKLVRKNNVSVMKSSGTAQVLALQQEQKPGSIELQRYNSNSGVVEVLPLTKLPQWSNRDQVDITIRMPESGTDSAKIMLNTSCPRWTTFTDNSEMHFPAVIHRDPSAMQQAYIPKEGPYHFTGVGFKPESESEADSESQGIEKNLFAGIITTSDPSQFRISSNRPKRKHSAIHSEEEDELLSGAWSK